VQATLKLRDEEVTWLHGELNQLSVSYEDQRQAGEEKEATILDQQQAFETARVALETDKKQVEGALFFLPFACWLGLFGIRSQFWFVFSVFRHADSPWELGNPGASHPDGLQFFTAGAGRAAGRRP
jgi:hypothetical protein